MAVEVCKSTAATVRYASCLRRLLSGVVVEGEPATGDRQAFVNGIFGDIFMYLSHQTSKVDERSPSPKSKVQSPDSLGASVMPATPRALNQKQREELRNRRRVKTRSRIRGQRSKTIHLPPSLDQSQHTKCRCWSKEFKSASSESVAEPSLCLFLFPA